MTVEPTTPRIRPLQAMVVLSIVTLLAYAPAIGGPFLNWDDQQMVVENVDLRPSSWPSILGYWNPHAPHLGLYAPLTYSLYFVLSAIGHAATGGLAPLPFHVANVTLHIVGGWLVWRLLRRLVRSEWAAVAGAAAFLLHPAQVEPVAWIGSLNTVLAATLALAALGLYVDAATRPTIRAAAVRFAAAWVVMLLATLAKPSVVAWPLAAVAIDRWFVGTAWRVVAMRGAIGLLATLPAIVAGKLAQPAAAIAAPSPLGRVWVTLDAIGVYVAHWLVPFGYAIDYGRTPAWVLTFPLTSVAFALLAIAVAGFVAWRRGPWLAAAIVGVSAMLPVLGWVPFDFQGLSTVADRYAYLAALGPAIVIAIGVRKFGRRAIRPAIVAGVLCTLSTAYHASNWSSDASLFEQAIRIHPKSAAANATLAYLDVQRADAIGDAELRRRLFAGAIERYRIAIATRSDDGKIRYGLANLYLRVGAFGDAAREYATLADRRPSDARVYINWGIALAQLGRVDEAGERFARALTIDPTSSDAHANWGLTLERAGDRDGATRHYRDALRLRPDHPLATAGLRRVGSD